MPTAKQISATTSTGTATFGGGPGRVARPGAWGAACCTGGAAPGSAAAGRCRHGWRRDRAARRRSVPGRDPARRRRTGRRVRRERCGRRLLEPRLRVGLLLRGRGSGRRREVEAACLRHRGGRRCVGLPAGPRSGLPHRPGRSCGGGLTGLLRGGYGPVGAESRWQRPDLVEHLHRLVVRTGFGQHLDGRGQRLARARRGPEPGLRVRLEQTRENLPQRLGDAVGGARGAVRGEVLHQRLGVGLLALDEVERDQADREEVRGEVWLGAHHLFRGEVTGRTDHVVGLGQPGFALAHRDAEVGEAQMRAAGSGRLHQDVGGLDVAVNHPFGVHRGEAGEQLVQQQADEARGQRAVVADDMGERAAAHQVHGEQDLVVVGGPAGRGQHVRVLDAQGLLADEAQQRVRVALLEHLGRDVPAAAVVPGAPDGADPAPSDRIDQLVPTSEDLTHCAAPAPRSRGAAASAAARVRPPCPAGTRALRGARVPWLRRPSWSGAASSGAPRSARPRPRCVPLRTP